MKTQKQRRKVLNKIYGQQDKQIAKTIAAYTRAVECLTNLSKALHRMKTALKPIPKFKKGGFYSERPEFFNQIH